MEREWVVRVVRALMVEQRQLITEYRCRFQAPWRQDRVSQKCQEVGARPEPASDRHPVRLSVGSSRPPYHTDSKPSGLLLSDTPIFDLIHYRSMN